MTAAAPQTAPARRAPQRTCVGCRRADDQANLVRFAAPGGTLVLDLARRAGGRGGWAHPRVGCVAAAGRGGLARALRRHVAPRELATLVAQLSLSDDNSPGPLGPRADHRSQTPPSLLVPDAVERPLRNQAKDDRSEDARV